MQKAKEWFQSKEWKVFPFQQQAWNAYSKGKCGIVNAPTGSGKTYSLLLPILLSSKIKKGIKAIWISPIRALTKEISNSATRAIDGLGMDWRVGIRTGDTSSTERKKQLSNPPDILITTPESLHVLLASKGYYKLFKNVEAIVVDEWHELLGNKRGVQVELFISRIRGIATNLRVWGISATIGNMDESMEVLLGKDAQSGILIRSEIKKEIQLKTVFPDEIEKFPWAGHLGIAMVDKIIPIIKESRSTLIFINTRAQCEIWYQRILEAAPELAGIIAMHHGSIDRHLRDWVEDSLHTEVIKAVCCTSSLDLGVDFRPVETIIQIGSPKGVARFVQRAGRSGHQPGAVSTIHFVPTHSLELMEAAALRSAIEDGIVESRMPYIRSFDVLLQFMMTLAVSHGFIASRLYEEIKSTYSYSSVTPEEWQWCLDFLVLGGRSLYAYDEYKKVIVEDGIYKVASKRIALRHRLSIGTISSTTMVNLKFQRGRRIGSVEEYFVSNLEPGNVFWFAGQSLEFVKLHQMTALVKKTKKKAKLVPSYLGGRVPLSSDLTRELRKEYDKYHLPKVEQGEELKELSPLFELQEYRSHVPELDELLVEYFEDDEGFHLLLYPFEGRSVHEGLGALLAKRISEFTPISFTIAMNDYGLELLSDRKLDINQYITKELFSEKNLELHIQNSINAAEMSRRRFRDIARISGLIFQGFPGKAKKDRHLQSSAQLIYDVFHEYESDNLLYLQTYDEVMTFQFEEQRLRDALERMRKQKIVIKRPEKATPFSFPIIVDRLRETVTSERLRDRVSKLTLALEKE